jgi:two-component system, NarL family, nitrate/nitrite response regulator NarL
MGSPSGEPSLDRTFSAQVMRPRVFILSDVRLLRDGLVLCLAEQPSVVVVGTADLAMSPRQIVEFRPDVLLLDVGTCGGLDMPLAFRQVLPDLKIVAIAVADAERDVFFCAEAGVSGFVSRTATIQDLVTAVHSAMRGELVCSPRIAALLFTRVGAVASKQSGDRDREALTRREHEIVSLMAEGLANKEIARELRIQNATVKNHIHSILSKLQVRHRGEVAARLRGVVARPA